MVVVGLCRCEVLGQSCDRSHFAVCRLRGPAPKQGRDSGFSRDFSSVAPCVSRQERPPFCGLMYCHVLSPLPLFQSRKRLFGLCWLWRNEDTSLRRSNNCSSGSLMSPESPSNKLLLLHQDYTLAAIMRQILYGVQILISSAECPWSTRWLGLWAITPLAAKVCSLRYTTALPCAPKSF